MDRCCGDWEVWVAHKFQGALGTYFVTTHFAYTYSELRDHPCLQQHPAAHDSSLRPWAHPKAGLWSNRQAR
jgi:hypothetical protein